MKLKIKMLILINNACNIETMRLLDFTNYRFAFSGQIGIGSAAIYKLYTSLGDMVCATWLLLRK